MEQKIHELTQRTGIGAQFGGKYFCHDVRVIRLPRHGASCPVGIGVSCSADRQVRSYRIHSMYYTVKHGYSEHFYEEFPLTVKLFSFSIALKHIDMNLLEIHVSN